ncbi:hypothetical protein FACS1894162_0380 [Bacteroidia bacterium]|nr:hypothetical protein FACS1894162_0380 [Bacteroidia bacterium]
MGGNKIIKEYYPWSKKVLDSILNAHKAGDLATLDLELTAQCSYANCIYCDSKPVVGKKLNNELPKETIRKLIQDAAKLKCHWIYTCGLGEPLEDDNFWFLVEEAHKYGINISLFTNALLINKENAKLLKKYGVCLIVKLDTLNSCNFDKILNRQGSADKIYQALECLLSEGYGKCEDENITDIAVSIVPSKLSIDGLEDVINYAKKNNIFPSIGELEQAGAMLINSKNYSDLALTKEEIQTIRKQVDILVACNYTRPICPTIIAGLHIDVSGNCVVDKKTGLNCKWFLLKEPDIVNLGNIKDNDLSVLLEKVKKYRAECFTTNKDHIQELKNIRYEFGGCGGSPHEVVKLAEKILNE